MKSAIQILSLTAFIGFFAGCSTTTPPSGCSSDKAWYRADASAGELQHDLAQCQYDALLTRRTTSVYGDTLGQTLLLRMVADWSNLIYQTIHDLMFDQNKLFQVICHFHLK